MVCYKLKLHSIQTFIQLLIIVGKLLTLPLMSIYIYVQVSIEFIFLLHASRELALHYRLGSNCANVCLRQSNLTNIVQIRPCQREKS